MQQAQGFFQIPAVDVEGIGNWFFNDVAARLQAQIPVARMQIKKTHVVIVIGRSKSPGPAARFASIHNSYIVIYLDTAQP